MTLDRDQRDQIKRDARDFGGSFGQSVLALLTELEQAEHDKQRLAQLATDMTGERNEHRLAREQAEHRLAKTPALVEALTVAPIVMREIRRLIREGQAEVAIATAAELERITTEAIAAWETD